MMRYAWMLTILCLACAGCSSPPANLPDIGKVTGTVTLDGEPVADAYVEFVPEHSRPSVAKTDAAGLYELQFDHERKGAAVGEHTVRIKTQSNPTEEEEERIPAKYNKASTLKVEVSAGENTHDFNLESK